MVINHSDLDIDKPKNLQEEMPYRVFSYEGIKLIAEKNGEVHEGEYKESRVWYVDIDDNDGSDVDLKADGAPAYYKCGAISLPKTGDASTVQTLTLLVIITFIVALFVVLRRESSLG